MDNAEHFRTLGEAVANTVRQQFPTEDSSSSPNTLTLSEAQLDKFCQRFGEGVTKSVSKRWNEAVANFAAEHSHRDGATATASTTSQSLVSAKEKSKKRGTSSIGDETRPKKVKSFRENNQDDRPISMQEVSTEETNPEICAHKQQIKDLKDQLAASRKETAKLRQQLDAYDWRLIDMMEERGLICSTAASQLRQKIKNPHAH